MSEKISVPKNLGRHGSSLYRRVLRDLDPGLTFTSLELERLESAARLREDLEAMRADLRATGLRVTTAKGEEVPNPMLLRIQTAERLLNATLEKLTVTRPEPKTGHLSRAQRNRLRDLDAGRRRAT